MTVWIDGRDRDPEYLHTVKGLSKNFAHFFITEFAGITSSFQAKHMHDEMDQGEVCGDHIELRRKSDEIFLTILGCPMTLSAICGTSSFHDKIENDHKLREEPSRSGVTVLPHGSDAWSIDHFEHPKSCSKQAHHASKLVAWQVLLARPCLGHWPFRGSQSSLLYY